MSDDATRQKRYRKRQRYGEAVYRVALPLVVVEALLVSGRMSDSASRNRESVSRELSAVLLDWARHWVPQGDIRRARLTRVKKRKRREKRKKSEVSTACRTEIFRHT